VFLASQRISACALRSHLCRRFVVRPGEVVSDGGRQPTEKQCKEKGVRSGSLEPERKHFRHHRRRAAVAEVRVIQEGVSHLPLSLTIGS
jgi:hypothetical protein